MDGCCEQLKLSNQLCYPIYLCSKEVVRRYNSVLSGLDLTYTQYIVMMYLWEHRSSNVSELGEGLMLDPSTLTPLLKKLEAKGYISRERSPEDERSLIISLTEKGERLSQDAASVPEQMKSCFGLSDEEGAVLYTLICKVIANIGKE
ncbi:MAG: MarR family transcriptional regulator [Ruminococcus sp.]|nr:MarR family transcriptional regulator [Ruminococcus sp.]